MRICYSANSTQRGYQPAKPRNMKLDIRKTLDANGKSHKTNSISIFFPGARVRLSGGLFFALAAQLQAANVLVAHNAVNPLSPEDR